MGRFAGSRGEQGNAERTRIIARFRRLKAEIEQGFIDCEVWNDTVRKPNEAPMNFDPFGEMRRMADAIDEMLANDPGHGPIAKLNFTRSH